MDEKKTYNFWGWKNADAPAATDEYPGINTPTDLYDALSHIWCADTCAPRMRDRWTKDRPGGNYHCYNVIGDCAFDLTSEQFGDEVLNYEDNPEQQREVHFAKEEKRLRYEYLKAALREYTACRH